MGAITIRNLAEPVHDLLRHAATARSMSVEALCRVLLTEAMTVDKAAPVSQPQHGFSEAPMAYAYPPKAVTAEKLPDLWGALKGSFHIPAGTDLTKPLDEAWQAEA
jgi:hypothetical protein